MPPQGIKLKPDQPMRRFVGIDITKALDTIAWGHLWNARFGWRNLLWELNTDPANNQRRIDKAHPKLPIQRLVRTHVGNTFADTCIMPQGVDASGKDALWPGPDATANLGDMNAACQFMQTFILNPRADSAASSLNDGGSGVGADIVYLSSHGSSLGMMSGDVFLADNMFNIGKAAVTGGQFAGPGWLLLSNCNTLKGPTHGDWIRLMTGPTPLRGIVGFQELCPLAPGSVNVFAGLIDRLALGKTFIEAWSGAMKANGMEPGWIVLCHENAAGDTIVSWNADSLQPIPATSKIFFFNKDNPSGKQVVAQPDPFEAFWSKGGTRITVANQSDPANKLVAGDNVVITVRPPTGTPTFATGTVISITLIYIRPDYPQNIDVNQIFTVTGQSGAAAPTTANLNPDSPGSDDSWNLTVTGTPAEVTLSLRCKALNMLAHPNMAFKLRVRISAPAVTHDFSGSGAIIVIF